MTTISAPGSSRLSTSGLLTEAQLAERWCLSVKTLQAARLKGNLIDFVKIGRAVRYRLVDVEAFEISQRRRSTTDRGGIDD